MFAQPGVEKATESLYPSWHSRRRGVAAEVGAGSPETADLWVEAVPGGSWFDIPMLWC